MGTLHSKTEQIDKKLRQPATKLPRTSSKSTAEAILPDNSAELQPSLQTNMNNKRFSTFSTTRGARARPSLSYPYPRSHTALLLPCTKNTPSTERSLSGSSLSRPPHQPADVANSFASKIPAVRQSSLKPSFVNSGKFGRFVHQSAAASQQEPQVLSPVYSCSERSSCDTSANVSRSETREFNANNDQPNIACEVLPNQEESAIVKKSLKFSKNSSSTNKSQNFSHDTDEKPIFNDIHANNKRQAIVRSHLTHPMPILDKNCNWAESTGQLVSTKNDFLSNSIPTCNIDELVSTKSSSVKPLSSERISDQALKVAQISEKLEEKCKRPTNFKTSLPKLTKSATISNSWKVAKVDSKPAPLAESESFIVENSPAVELVPSFFAKYVNFPNKLAFATKSTKHKTGGMANGTDSANGQKYVEFKRFPNNQPMINPSTKNLVQARLKNSSSYAKTQHLIYGKFDKKGEDSVNSPGIILDVDGISRQEKDIEIHVLHCDFITSNLTEFPRELNSFESLRAQLSKFEVGSVPKSDSANSYDLSIGRLKFEMADSGVKTVSCSEGTNSSGPDGLIDDEMADQPQLIGGARSLEAVLAHIDSCATTLTEVSLMPSAEVNLCQESIQSFEAQQADRFATATVQHRSLDSNDVTIRNSEASVVAMTSGTLDVDEWSKMTSLNVDWSDVKSASKLDWSKTTLSSCNWSKKSSLHALQMDVENSVGQGNSGAVGLVPSAHFEIPIVEEHQNRKEDAGVADSFDALDDSSQSRKKSQSAFSFDRSQVDICAATNADKSAQSPTDKQAMDQTCNSGQAAVCLDQQTYRHLSQDLTVVRTLLSRLKRLLNESDAVTSPFDVTVSMKNGYLKQRLKERIVDDSTYDDFSMEDLKLENSALRTQVALLRQEIDEKNKLISSQMVHVEQLERLAASNMSPVNEITKPGYLPDLLPSSNTHFT